MYGKMTTSRMGIIGSFLLSNFSLGFDNWSPVSGPVVLSRWFSGCPILESRFFAND
jgi:hypothetical protein